MRRRSDRSQEICNSGAMTCESLRPRPSACIATGLSDEISTRDTFFTLSPPNTAGTRTKALTLLVSFFLFRLARGFWRRNSASIFVGQTHPVSAFEWQLIGGKPHERLYIFEKRPTNARP